MLIESVNSLLIRKAQGWKCSSVVECELSNWTRGSISRAPISSKRKRKAKTASVRWPCLYSASLGKPCSPRRLGEKECQVLRPLHCWCLAATGEYFNLIFKMPPRVSSKACNYCAYSPEAFCHLRAHLLENKGSEGPKIHLKDSNSNPDYTQSPLHKELHAI